MLNINKKIENTSADFVLEGRLDTVTAPELEGALKEVLDGLKERDFEKYREGVIGDCDIKSGYGGQVAL